MLIKFFFFLSNEIQRVFVVTHSFFFFGFESVIHQAHSTAYETAAGGLGLGSSFSSATPDSISDMAEQTDKPIQASENDPDVDELVANVGATRSPLGLLDLPTELRLMIFRHLLVHPQGLDLETVQLPSRPWPSLDILRASRLIHGEAFEVFYRENLFLNFLGALESSLDPLPLRRIPFPLVIDTLRKIHVNVTLWFRLFAIRNFLRFMPHLGNPSIIRDTLMVEFVLNGSYPRSSDSLGWFARALGRFTNFRTVELQFRYCCGGENPAFDVADYFRLAMEPVLGHAESVTLDGNGGLRFRPVDHLNRLQDDGDWADFLGGLRLEWNEDPTDADDSKTPE